MANFGFYPSNSSSSRKNMKFTENFHNEINVSYADEWPFFPVDQKSEKNLPFLLNLTDSFETTSKICQRFKIIPEIEFIALDTLESLLESFLYDLSKDIETEMKGDLKAINGCWEEASQIFEKDVPLIILLNISLAAKYIDRSTHFNLGKVLQLVHLVSDEKYDITSIKEHEMCLFKNIGFKVSRPVALHSMEQMIKLVYNEEFLNISLDEFLKVGLLTLRFAYMEKYKIYSSLINGISNSNTFKTFTRDKVLLAAAVVFATCNTVSRSAVWIKDVLKQLSDTCGFQEQDIILLSEKIMQFVKE
uniref:CSON011930 protein n=1 Tax=Culicoides sonorensis TaxID=179676 RepID=A0A336M493_CULSO